MPFEGLQIIPQILKAIDKLGFTEPTPIQNQAIPVLIEGKDVLGCAQTGTGKTAAFSIPILQGIYIDKNAENTKRVIKALIVTPTRELAAQVSDCVSDYGKYLGLRKAVIYGGISQHPQVTALKNGVDILIATPGRLLDLMNQKYIDLSNVKYLVLDEADNMLDMGFIHDIHKIISQTSEDRQTMLFSATMPANIEELANKILKDPVKIAVTPVSSPVDVIEQSLYYVSKKNKKNLLIHLLSDKLVESALVFSRTKHGADKLCDALNAAGIRADAIHGNKSQRARQIALNKFKAKRVRVLVATDIAARGIDINELSHVINYDLPEVPETYVHRIGRTGRAGLTGKAFSFCDIDETGMLKDIQKLIIKKIDVVQEHPYKEEYEGKMPNNPAPYRRFRNKSDGKNGYRSKNPRKANASRKQKQYKGNM